MHSRLVSRRLLAIGVVVLAALPVGSCSEKDPAQSAERVAHADGEGPLSASSWPGGSSIHAPPGKRPWYGSWGSFILCSTESDPDLVLERVRIEADVIPLSVSDYVREVTGADLRRAAARGMSDDYAPFTTNAGSPPKFDQPYVDFKPAGTFREGVADVEVDQSCEVSARLDEGFQELVVTLEVDDNGAQVPDFYIDYRSHGRPMTLHVEWEMTACGTAVSGHAELCA